MLLKPLVKYIIGAEDRIRQLGNDFNKLLNQM